MSSSTTHYRQQQQPWSVEQALFEASAKEGIVIPRDGQVTHRTLASSNSSTMANSTPTVSSTASASGSGSIPIYPAGSYNTTAGLSVSTSDSALASSSSTSAGVGLRSPPPASPCLVHSHLDNSLSSFIAKKDAQAAKKRGKRSGKERGAAEDDDSDTASEGAGDHVIHEESEEGSSSEEDEEPSLTRQLAETAVSVREMSKELGRARVMSHIQSVLIITKARDNHLIRLTRELALWLMQTPRNGRDRGLVVYVDQQLKKSKRFDAEGMERDYPELFRSVKRRYSRSSSSTNLPTQGSHPYPNGGSHTGIHTPNVLHQNQRMTPLSSLTESLKRSGSSGSTSGGGNGEHVRKGEEEGQLRYWTNEMCAKSPHLFDFVITLGGDGTVLYASWLFQHVVPPIIPFALGSLGFLTCFDFEKYSQTLNNAINNGIRVNLRMRFTCTVYRAIEGEEDKKRRAVRSGKTGGIFMNSLTREGWEAIESGGEGLRSGSKKKDKEIKCFSTRPVESFEVLNDLVVDRGPSPYVSLLELFGDEHHMTTVQADGLTVSTPTGSTAYSLSAGGSLVHPEIPALLITPICPHTLSFRPMLLPDSMELRICVPYNSRSTAWASFDGRGRVELRQGDHIKVTASRYPFPTVCADNQSKDWFNSISRTLKWNERQRQKSFVILEEGHSKPEKKEQVNEKKASAHGPLTPNSPAHARLARDERRPSSVEEDHEEEEEEEEEEEDDFDDEDDEYDEARHIEEDEAFDIDDLSSNPATSASSPAFHPHDPAVGNIPSLASSTAPPFHHQIRREASPSSDAPDLEDDERFSVPPPHPPRLSSRHSHTKQTTSNPNSPTSPSSPSQSILFRPSSRGGQEGVRDHIHEERVSRPKTSAPAGARLKSRSRSRDRPTLVKPRSINKAPAAQKRAIIIEAEETSEPGRAFAVVGNDTDSSASGSGTGGE